MLNPAKPMPLKIVRIFVSSTFRDMHAERDYINRFVFPELRSRCIRHGIGFVGIDLRWGVTEEEAEQYGALEICLDEIKRCNFFISLLGDRYGWIPPPDKIPQKFFEAVLQKMDLTGGDATWLDEWYKLDETVEPAVYRLHTCKLPIDVTEKLIHLWESVKLPHADDSITSLEITRGALESSNPEICTFFYFRNPGVHMHPYYPKSLVPIFEERALRLLNELPKADMQELLAGSGKHYCSGNIAMKKNRNCYLREHNIISNDTILENRPHLRLVNISRYARRAGSFSQSRLSRTTGTLCETSAASYRYGPSLGCD